MLNDRAADGSPLDPHRDFEKDYKRLDQLYTDINRAMLTVYAEFLRPSDIHTTTTTIAIDVITAINYVISTSIVSTIICKPSATILLYTTPTPGSYKATTVRSTTAVNVCVQHNYLYHIMLYVITIIIVIT
jgi:hypothetical protein